VISSCILIQTIGVLGVAIGTVIAYSAVYIVFTYYYYSKELHFDMKRLYVETVLMNLPFIIVLLIVGFLLRMVPIYGWGGLIIRVILFMVAYIIAIGVLSKDKEMVRATMKRAVRKN
jgi:O-antigen/teichoic acid export membrane protein